MKYFEYGIQQTNALFLLLFVLMGGFIIETLNCDIQYQLTNNRILKLGVVLLSIYISFIITDKKPNNPLVTFKNSLIIWIFFILFTKTNSYYTAIIISLLIIIFILNNYRDYQKEKYKKESLTILDLQIILLLITVIFLLLGNIHYFLIKRQKYGKQFSLNKFIFGIIKCHSLKN
jgi:hypothetical protein